LSIVRIAVAVATVAVVIVACTSGGADGPSPTALLSTQPARSGEGQREELVADRCASGADGAGDLPGWSMADVGDPDIVPIIQSSLLAVGPNRFLYNVLDPTFRQLAAPEATSSVVFYALERDPTTPASTQEASYLSSGLGRGLYRANVGFDCAGEWGAEIAFELPDGSTARQRVRFEVLPHGTTPAIGAPAPRSESPTARTAAELAAISSDPHPWPPAYDTSVAEAVTSGRPSLIFFATPGFCQSGYCGPTVELVKSVAREYEDEVDLVTVEPYELRATSNGLQPALDEDGHLRPVAAARDYGIPVEPYLFVVDAAGDVFARFEGIVGADELRAALEDVLGEST
jgi:hypothetical protein